MRLSRAAPEGAPKVIFAALDADVAADLEPRFAANGCAVISKFQRFPYVSGCPAGHS